MQLISQAFYDIEKIYEEDEQYRILLEKIEQNHMITWTIRLFHEKEVDQFIHAGIIKGKCVEGENQGIVDFFIMKDDYEGYGLQAHLIGEMINQLYMEGVEQILVPYLEEKELLYRIFGFKVQFIKKNKWLVYDISENGMIDFSLTA